SHHPAGRSFRLLNLQQRIGIGNNGIVEGGNCRSVRQRDLQFSLKGGGVWPLHGHCHPFLPVGYPIRRPHPPPQQGDQRHRSSRGDCPPPLSATPTERLQGPFADRLPHRLPLFVG